MPMSFTGSVYETTRQCQIHLRHTGELTYPSQKLLFDSHSLADDDTDGIGVEKDG